MISKKDSKKLSQILWTIATPIVLFGVLVYGSSDVAKSLVVTVAVVVVLNYERIFLMLRKIVTRSNSKEISSVNSEAVIVHLLGNGLPDIVYEQYDVTELEDQLDKALTVANVGSYDGNEYGPSETVLYMYGPDSEKMFAAIRSVLESHPLCERARVIIRKGGPGSEYREENLC